EQAEALARLMLDRVKRDLGHERAPRLLAEVCVLSRQIDSDEVPACFAEAADLLIPRFADRADINHFCECFGTAAPAAPAWAARFEPHLRTILKENRHRHMRAFARFALARVVQL